MPINYKCQFLILFTGIFIRCCQHYEKNRQTFSIDRNFRNFTNNGNTNLHTHKKISLEMLNMSEYYSNSIFFQGEQES